MKHLAVVELWDDGMYSIYVPDMEKHNLNAQGETVSEAKEKLFEAVLDYVNFYNEIGKTIPKEIDNPTFEYKYDLASFFDYYDWVNPTKLAAKIGINPSLMRQYKSRISLASEKQTGKIQEGINKLGLDLASVKL